MSFSEDGRPSSSLPPPPGPSFRMLRSPSLLKMTRVRISITRGSRTGHARVTHGSRICHSESDVKPRLLARAVTRTRPQYVATRLIIDGADAADARATWLPVTFLARLSFQRGLRPVSDYGRDYTSCWDLHEGSLAPPVMQWHTVMKGGLPPASPHRGAGIVTTPYSPATPPTRDYKLLLCCNMLSLADGGSTTQWQTSRANNALA